MTQKPTVPAKKPLDPSELKIALDNRAFEIQLFWQRSNYFLVLMTALGIGAFSVKDPAFSPAIALFATACSYFWFRTNLGSKFWQESWEVEVTNLSKEFEVRSFEKSLEEVRDQVTSSLQAGQKLENRSYLRLWIDRLTIRKYSVTYNMILLSLLSTFVWFIVAAVMVVRALVDPGSFDPQKHLATPAGPSAPAPTTGASADRPISTQDHPRAQIEEREPVDRSNATDLVRNSAESLPRTGQPPAAQ